MTRQRTIRTTVAGIVILAFFGTWLAMEWTGRQPDSIVLLGAAAIVMGAGYHLWDQSMQDGVEAVDDLQGGNDAGGESEE